ncbi:asparaginyl-tRNA synthetase [Colletotrichum orchidophilum]|uniref:asparagine--tRNA ligase n=1 Tax=Colletotrichum orchidophilum TaxID=1209926 RepID=A0A1G4ASR5_9PEZI|nr:asparaginyl-tRNA synthetase [Colletotrichum orchidophilum]OHE92210.1 asparaginyl-tRNA synthetase [Colletotrichum orchidophilum]
MRIPVTASSRTLARPSLLHAQPIRRRHITTVSRKTVAQFLEWKPDTEVKDVVVNGYVRSVRNMKTERFVNIGDGSSRSPIQALVSRSHDESANLRVGAAVRLRGVWTPSKTDGQSHELKVDHVEILGPSDAKTFPIQKKYQTPDYLRTMPHLRPRIPLNAAILRLRSEAVALLTQFFASRDFIQTHPPIITSSDCEGAGEVFNVHTGSAETPAISTTGKDKAANLFFRSPKYLTVSTQLHLEALAQSLGHVWTLSPTFRAERSDTSRHMSEFYMLEAEMSFVDELDEVMNLVEDMLRSLATGLYQTRTAQELRQRQTPGENRTAEDDLVPIDEVERRWLGMMQNPASRWPRITYADAIKLLKAEEDQFELKPTWESGLHSEHEKFLAKTLGATSDSTAYSPVFVTHYPREIKAFYMRISDAATAGPHLPSDTVDCFDLLVPDLCEIAGGSMREHRLTDLLATMTARGMGSQAIRGQAENSGSDLDWYVDLRRWGSNPHGGFGLGFDRLLSYLVGVPNVRDVVAFPRWFGRCDC